MGVVFFIMFMLLILGIGSVIFILSVIIKNNRIKQVLKIGCE